MGRTVGGRRRAARATAAALAALALLLSCEGAPEKPVRDLPVPADPGPRDPGPEAAPADAAREGVEIPAPDCESDPGAPGCPCAAAEDCDSRFCNRRPGTCAAPCDGGADCASHEACARVPGVPGPVCADRFPTACAACQDDAGCLGAFVPGPVACEGAAGEAWCLPACGPGDLCPAGMACRAAGEGGGKRCEPDPGPCPCTPEAAALGREGLPGCTDWHRDDDRDGAGVKGDSRCLCGPFAPYEAATDDDCQDGDAEVLPGHPELCNQADDDCDGETDEALGLAESPCSRLGVCAAEGVTAACTAGRWVCDASAVPGHEATEAACDGKDNDCDGVTDEDLDGQPGHCLSQGVCAISGAVQVRCDGGLWRCTYLPALGYEEGAEQSCDDRDNDCDGATDEDFPYQDPSGGDLLAVGDNCGVGACLGGRVQCAADDRSATCSTAVLAGPESCDTRGLTAGRDEDCDGRVDEEFLYGLLTVYRDPANPPAGRNDCFAPGECGGVAGQVECLDSATAGCSTGPGGSADRSVAESCNNRDDDCDGLTDEDLHDPAASGCSLQGVCGLHPEKIGVTCQAGKWVCDYRAVPGYEAVETRCDGADGNCDGVADDPFGWIHPLAGGLVKVGKPCGLGLCAGGQVQCAADGRSAECSADALAAPESCDGLDNDCDGRTDEDFRHQGTPVWIDVTDLSQGASPCTGQGACAAATGGVVECRGADAAGCSLDFGGSAWAGSAESCNGDDDDCDGETDEGLTLSDSDCRVTGVCAPALVQAACVGGDWSCDYSAIAVYQADVERSCDALDNDCDGQTDEDFVLTDWDGTPRMKGNACGTGACAGGFAQCRANASGLECSTAGMSTPESCNTKDDDCDGQADELGAELCNDGRNCTLDSCNGGACRHDIADGWCFIDNTCRADGVFNPAASCQHCASAVSKTQWTPTGDGGACDADGSGCTVGDTCSGGTCTPGPAPDCRHLDGTCTTGACRSTSALSYACEARPANEGGACSDGNACTKSDRCTSGTCAGTGYSCDDGLSCTADSCDGAGGCTNTLQAGSCLIDGKCWAHNAINTANTCQVCESTTSPRAWTTKPNGDPCSDGSACTENDRCQAGACQPGTTKDCNDGNACTQDSCNPAAPSPSVACSHAGLTGTACDDGQACTWRDTCLSGSCYGESYACTAPIFCVTSICDGLGGCLDTVNAGWCWIGGSCIVAGVSKVGEPCLYCDPSRDKRGWSTYPGGTTCDDGDACTAGDRCVGSTCTPTGLTSCDDGNPCTTDTCVSGATGCTRTNNSLTCSDSNACTIGDQCSGGTCQSGAPKTCPALSPDCDPATGACACGTGGGATTCSSATADRCTAGECLCGANPACDLFGANPDCSKDATPRCGCCAPGSTSGCAVCPATRADTCLDGVCQCGANGMCSIGKVCCDGTCYTGSTCP